jgi:hypothetical protein
LISSSRFECGASFAPEFVAELGHTSARCRIHC